MAWVTRFARLNVSYHFIIPDASKVAEFLSQGVDASKKRKREYKGSALDNSIPKPHGTAGKGGRLGYNLQNAMGLSGPENEQTYLSLLVSTHGSTR